MAGQPGRYGGCDGGPQRRNGRHGDNHQREGQLAAGADWGHRGGRLRGRLGGDGPHGLVAGTTGSGKSELLRSLVVSLAATYDAEHLNVVLVDYKGGSAFDRCASLPHTVGLVTDLDEHLGRRALVCLEAELRYREQRLRAAGASDLGEYAASIQPAKSDRGGHAPCLADDRAAPGPSSSPAPGPLPRLVVVIDEFATLAAELPDFIDSLVGIAQRGRSLGIHLVLATQRPSGAVNDTIRANTNLRIALRVQDPAESTDVIGTPQAAAIRRRQAGRGCVRLGPGEVFTFQAAQVTSVTHLGPVKPGSAPVEVRPFSFGPESSSRAHRQDHHRDIHEGVRDDLDLLVEAICAAHRDLGLAPGRRPWPPPLPSHLTLDELETWDANHDSDADADGEPHSSLGAPLGLLDDPAHQRQRPFCWGPELGNLLLYGVTGSGTTTALATLAISLARRYSSDSVHLYVLDFDTGGLAPLADLPQVGAVIGSGEPERQVRLIRFLRTELERRRQEHARAAAQGRSASPRHDRPVIVLLIDSYGSLAEALDQAYGPSLAPAYDDQLMRVAADGPALGIFVVATADRPGAIPAQLAALVPEKLVFRLADGHEYGIFGIGRASMPAPLPGRCVRTTAGCELQVALPSPADLMKAVALVGAAHVYAHAGVIQSPPAAIGVLPDEVKVDDLLGAGRIDQHRWVLPLALGDAELLPVGFCLDEGDHALIAGPVRCGKSTALCTLARVVATHGPDVTVIAVAPCRSPLRQSVYVDQLVTDPHELDGVLEEVTAQSRPALLLVDDADELSDPGGAFRRLFARRRPDVHVVAAGRADALRRAYGHWTQDVRQSRQGIALRPVVDLDGDLWQAVLPRRGPARFIDGRGYLVCEGRVELIQVASP